MTTASKERRLQLSGLFPGNDQDKTVAVVIQI